jgi:hypothetical protein
MIVAWQEQLRPGIALRQIVQQATTALIAMDAERLEELARCCADLNREIVQNNEIAEAAIELQKSENDVRLLGRVLYETRANLTVLSRLHAIRLREVDGACGSSLSQSASYDVLPSLSTAERTAEYGDN